MDNKHLKIDAENNKALRTIDVLSKSLAVEGINLNYDLISTFKKIRKYKRESFSVHNSENEFVALIYDWKKKLSPNFTEFWYVSLKKFETVLEGFGKMQVVVSYRRERNMILVANKSGFGRRNASICRCCLNYYSGGVVHD